MSTRNMKQELSVVHAPVATVAWEMAAICLANVVTPVAISGEDLSIYASSSSPFIARQWQILLSAMTN